MECRFVPFPAHPPHTETVSPDTPFSLVFGGASTNLDKLATEPLKPTRNGRPNADGAE